MKQTGVLFDYNGVIVDDEAIHERAYKLALRDYGIELTGQLHRQHIQGRTALEGLGKIKELFPDKLKEVTAGQLLRAKIEHYKRETAGQDIFYADARQALETLSSEYKIGLVTSAVRELVEPYLDRKGLKHYFNAIVAADDVKAGKPDPEPYRRAAAAIGLPAANIVAVEDTSYGIQSAKAAGLKCIAVPHTHSREELAEADLIIPDLSFLSRAVVESLLCS